MIFRIFMNEAVAIPRVGSLRMAKTIAAELRSENPGADIAVAVRRRAPLLWDRRPSRWEKVTTR